MNTKLVRTALVLAGGLLLSYGLPSVARAQIAGQDAGQTQAAPADEPGTPNGPDLHLTDDQKAQMKKIHEGAKAQVDAVKGDSSLSADQKQAKIQQIHRDTHKQVIAMLTPEQRTAMRQWRHEHRGSQQQPPQSNQ
jgi:periplasmic protein CpxP/Spy